MHPKQHCIRIVEIMRPVPLWFVKSTAIMPKKVLQRAIDIDTRITHLYLKSYLWRIVQNDMAFVKKTSTNKPSDKVVVRPVILLIGDWNKRYKINSKIVKIDVVLCMDAV